MTSPKRDSKNAGMSRAFLTPVLWIVALVASYWMLADWQTLPNLITNAIAAI